MLWGLLVSLLPCERCGRGWDPLGPPGTAVLDGGYTGPWWGRAGGEDHGGFLAVATTCVSHLGDGAGAVLGSCSRSSGSRRDSKDEALLPLGSAGS